MSFKLPDFSYPLVVDSIGKYLAMGTEATMHCRSCKPNGRYAKLNLVTIAQRHGMNYGCSSDDLRQVVACGQCKAAGGDWKQVDFVRLEFV